MPATVAAQAPTKPAAAVAGRSIDLSPSLAADGTFLGARGLAGTVDLRAWSLVSDLAAGEPPRFAPVTAATATPTGPWFGLGSNGAGDGVLNWYIYAIAVSGSNVYVGGLFTNAAGIPQADKVAKWNGSTWSALGSNAAGDDGALNDSVTALAVSGTDVYVGGWFQNAAGIPTADHVAKWNGSSWSAMGSNGAGNGAINGPVDVLKVSGGNVYVGGAFNNAAGLAAGLGIAMWNGSTWSTLGSTAATNGVNDIAISGGDIYVGTSTADIAGIPEADGVAKWNGSTWSALGSNGSGNGAIQGDVFATAMCGGALYVGGSFTNAAVLGGADYIAKWNGSAWSALGTNNVGNGMLNDVVLGLACSGSDLYVGGQFTNAAGIAEADNVAKWNGSAWSALGSDGAGGGALTGWVESLAVSGTDLYAGGSFANAAGIPTADYVARWSLIPFTDIADSPYKSDIIWVYQQGITSGCTATTYCPNDPVSRAQMATFLARALHLSGAAPDAFTDDNGSIYEPNINLVAQAGIASGCGGTLFCPNGLVSRAQMATFLARALHLSGPAPDAFTDDNGSIYEPNINLVAREGIATGCGGTLFCPNANVTRGQMAAFLHRAFGP
jgi:hypothetical protein